MNKKFFKSLLSSLLALMLVVSCFAIPSSAAVALRKSSVTLTKGYATTLSVTGTSSKVKWSTGDKSVATVTTAGKVSGKGVGSTYIYASVGSSTLKCKVTVVAGKITAGVDELEMTAGKSKIVKMTCKGTHTISISNSNKAVAYGTWNGAKFDGDIVPLTIKAVSSGSARIKVYAKNYPSVYAYIDVTVNGGTSTANTTLTAQYTSAELNMDQTASIRVYSTNKYALNVQSSDTRIATATISSPVASGSNYYSTVSIKPVANGQATIRISSKTNSKIYTDIAVAVKGSLEDYYTITKTQPSTKVYGDQVIRFTYNYTNYYMLVPKDYDVAYSNSLIAFYTNTYNYYDVYTMYPTTKLPTDSVKTLYTVSGVKYVLVPANFDEVKYNTIVAKYNNSYEYYAVYNDAPVKKLNSDIIDRWYITDTSGATISRYIMYPYNYDKSRVDSIIAEDKGNNNAYTPYTILSSIPTNVTSNEQIISVLINNSNRFMVVSKNMSLEEIAKMNDAVSAATGKVSYYQWYSKRPSDVKDNETVIQMASSGNGGPICYLIYRNTDSSSVQSTGFDNASKGVQMFDYR